MRGMIKWKPFNTLLNKRDLNDILIKRSIESKPIIMEDRINEINDILLHSINKQTTIKIKIFDKGNLKTIIGKINKINIIEKNILVNNTKIYFKNIVKVEETN